MSFLWPKRDDPSSRPLTHLTWIQCLIKPGSTCRKRKCGPCPLQAYKTQKSHYSSVLSALRVNGNNGGPVSPPIFLSKSAICLFESLATNRVCTTKEVILCFPPMAGQVHISPSFLPSLIQPIFKHSVSGSGT